MNVRLDLFTEVGAAGAAARLSRGKRVLYVAEGDLIVRSAGQSASLSANSAWYGTGECAIAAGKRGVRVLRFELTAGESAGAPLAGDGFDSRMTLGAMIEIAAPGAHLLRCDRVDFPPGGIAYLHVHQGPGLRCLLEGSFRVEVNGKSHLIAPGEAWFETGPDPVLAYGSETERSSFVRVMVLPRTLLGKSSIRYVKPEDASKPKSQQYQVFVDEAILL